MHLIEFYADKRSTPSPETLPNKSGWRFSVLCEKQFGRWVTFASYAYNTAQGGDVAGTFADRTATLGVAYKNPLKVRGEAAVGVLYMHPIEELVGKDAGSQTGLEVYWRISATRNIWVTPGLQLVFNPALVTDPNFSALPHIKFRLAL